MKKHLLFIGFLAAAAAFQSCSSDEATEQALPQVEPAPSTASSNADAKEIILHGVADGDALIQKTALADDGKSVNFASGDLLSLFDQQGVNNKFELTQLYSNGASADFKGEVSNPDNSYMVLYPYQEDARYDASNKVIHAFMPYQQHAVKNSFDPAANLSIAICGADGKFQLKNVGALVKFTTNESFTKIELRANDARIIAGELDITVGDDGSLSSVGAYPGLTSCGIELLPPSGSDVIEPGTYYMVVKPATCRGGFTISFFNGPKLYTPISTTKKRFATKDITFERNKGVNCGDLITVNSVFIPMIKVAKGSFAMGNGTDEHNVTLTKDFYLGQTTVTQQLYEAVMETNPSSNSKGGQYPVEQVTWADASAFITKLNAATSKSFRLPTEAEWEYAARGGVNNNDFEYSGSNDYGDVAWTFENSEAATHEVALKNPNTLGLFDMSGNVWEWVNDYYDAEYYKSSPVQDPKGPEKEQGSPHSLRGGAFDGLSYGYSRVWSRGESDDNTKHPNVGFRLAL